mmetsp:Transcript_88380/g.189810  ORF Transcript_88380/g.189810 Transcript_88380/m.189810 type:complete len:228 (-) Transcript_88380:30-713(-)
MVAAAFFGSLAGAALKGSAALKVVGASAAAVSAASHFGDAHADAGTDDFFDHGASHGANHHDDIHEDHAEHHEDHEDHDHGDHDHGDHNDENEGGDELDEADEVAHAAEEVEVAHGIVGAGRVVGKADEKVEGGVGYIMGRVAKATAAVSVALSAASRVIEARVRDLGAEPWGALAAACISPNDMGQRTWESEAPPQRGKSDAKPDAERQMADRLMAEYALCSVPAR